MNCKKMMTSLTAAALCVSLAACGSTGAASGAAASSESTAAESAATSEAAPAESAAETTGSGKVTVYMPSPAGLADKLAEGFTAKTGIEVEQFQGTTGESCPSGSRAGKPGSRCRHSGKLVGRSLYEG